MTLTVRLESSTENALTHFCDSQALSKSQVVHRALNDWLKAQSSGTGHALLAFVPQSVQGGKQLATKAASTQKTGSTYKPYSKAALRSKVLGASRHEAL